MPCHIIVYRITYSVTHNNILEFFLNYEHNLNFSSKWFPYLKLTSTSLCPCNCQWDRYGCTQLQNLAKKFAILYPARCPKTRLWGEGGRKLIHSFCIKLRKHLIKADSLLGDNLPVSPHKSVYTWKSLHCSTENGNQFIFKREACFSDILIN